VSVTAPRAACKVALAIIYVTVWRGSCEYRFSCIRDRS